MAGAAHAEMMLASVESSSHRSRSWSDVRSEKSEKKEAAFVFFSQSTVRALLIISWLLFLFLTWPGNCGEKLAHRDDCCLSPSWRFSKIHLISHRKLQCCNDKVFFLAFSPALLSLLLLRGGRRMICYLPSASINHHFHRRMRDRYKHRSSTFCWSHVQPK